MIIAIMGNTFENCKESEQKYERSMKVALLADYIDHIKIVDPSASQKQFIVLVTPEEEEEANSEWEGSVNMIRKAIS